MAKSIDVLTKPRTAVTILQRRNKNSTAFIEVAYAGDYGVHVWEARSQGPSAGGYSKPIQAAERLYEKMTGKYVSWGGESLKQLAKAAAVAARKKVRARRR